MKRLLALATVCLLLPAPARAYFEEARTGSRGTALGPSAIAVVTDASAYYWNPAGLTDLPRPELSADFISQFGLPDVQSGAAAGAFRFRGTTVGLGWHHIGLKEVYGEDILSLAAARRVWTRASGHRLSVGATFKFGRAAFQPFPDPVTGGMVGFGAISKGSFDVGTRWQTPWRADLAWVVRDVLQPRYEFVAGSGGQLMKMRNEIAAAFRWNRESTISVGWAQVSPGRSTVSAGLEVTFYDVFAIRTGLSNLATIYQTYGKPEDIHYEGGFGIYHKGYNVDAVASTTRDLGASYRVTLRVPLHKEGGR